MALSILFQGPAAARPRTAPPPRITRSRIFHAPYKQGAQATPFPLMVRPAGARPRIAPAVRPGRGRIWEVPLTSPVPGPVQLWWRQPGSASRWVPAFRQTKRRSQLFQPGWPQGQRGIAVSSVLRSSQRWAMRSLLARRGRIMIAFPGFWQGSAALSAAGSLTAVPVGINVSAPLLSGTGRLQAEAIAGPDLTRLWNAYLAARQAAHQASANWKMVRGSYDESIVWFQKYYAADQAETAAYTAYVTARDNALGTVKL